MKIYVLLHSSMDEQLGYDTVVKVYVTKEEAKAAIVDLQCERSDG